VSPIPFPFWVAVLLLTLLVRRDRPLRVRLPLLGFAGLVTAGAVYTGWRSTLRPGELTFNDVLVLHLLWTAAGACGVLTCAAWLRALWRQDRPQLWQWARSERGWVAGSVALGALACGGYFVLGQAFAVHGVFEQYDTLYGADPGRYMHVIAGTATDNEQITHKHPLFPLVSRGLYLATLPWAGPGYAPLAVSCVGGGLCVTLAALYFRRITGSRAIGVLFAIMLGASAGHLIFCAQPETYALCAAGLVLLHLLLAESRARVPRFRHEVLAGVFAAGITITSAVPALICYLARHRAQRRWRRLVRWSATAAVVGCILVASQDVALPYTALGRAVGEYRAESAYFVRDAASKRLPQLARGLLLEGVVGAPPHVEATARGPMLTAGRYSTLLSASVAGIWLCALAGTGVILLQTRAWRTPTLVAAAACLGFEFLLHGYYGREQLFLYACTYTFYLLAIVAHAVRYLPHRGAVGVSAALLAALLINNVQFAETVLGSLAH